VLGTVSTVVDNFCNNLGTVLAQSPAAGTHVNLGSAVSITIGAPPKHPCP
jgi:beta-lactam-binding protein with PASTA domain